MKVRTCDATGHKSANGTRRRIAINLTTPLFFQLREIAVHKGKSLSDIARIAVTKYLKEQLENGK